ncbi:MAG: hypothetical protein AAF799_13325 [Myxococcota bacterium]
MSILCTAALLALACAGDDSAADAGADDGATTQGATTEPTSSTSQPVDTDTEGDDTAGDTEEDTDIGTGTDTGEPLPECPEAEDVSAAFVIEIDGQEIDADYAEFSGGVFGRPKDWNVQDTLPEINSMCTILEQMPGSLTLTCNDNDAVERTFTVRPEASEAFALDVGKGPVNVWYQIVEDGDMLEHVSDTAGHSFVLSNDAGVILAGIDGRYTMLGSASEAWPDLIQGRVREPQCTGRDMAEISLGEEVAELLEGSAGDLGDHRVIVETAVFTLEFDGELNESVDTARWIVGRPAAK